MKSKNKRHLSSYERAQKKVQKIKGFYGHLAVYLIVVPTVLFIRPGNARFIGISNSVFEDFSLLNWIDWNTYGTPIIWGLFLAYHGFNVFGKNPFLGKAWEERQLRKYLDEDKTD